MGRLNVYLPDELAATVRTELPDVNMSAVLQRALADLLGCRHYELCCRRCSTPIDADQIRAVGLDAVFRDVLARFERPALSGERISAEGAARVVIDVFQRHRSPAAHRQAAPRPSQRNREWARRQELEDARRLIAEDEATRRHPSTGNTPKTKTKAAPATTTRRKTA